jgi:sulfite exporter TauE/SafE
MSTMILVSAILMGLLGSTHCVAMCGGVVAVACGALPTARRGKPLAQVPYTLAYNAGRVASYACAGALAGLLGSTLASFGFAERAFLGLRVLAAALMIAVGLYLAGFVKVLRWAERAGEPVWRRIAPLARRFVPVRTPGHALLLGLMWGWMPCGLVYAALGAAATTGSALGGAATMVAFGLGTLPTLLAMGSAAALVARLGKSPAIRTAAAVAILGFGALQLAHVGRAWASAGSTADCHSCCAHHG